MWVFPLLGIIGDSEDAKKAKLKAALEAAFSGKKDKGKSKKDAKDSDSEGTCIIILDCFLHWYRLE